MSFLQALLIAVACYLASEGCPWLAGDFGGFYVFSKPLVSGLIVGLILGDVSTGIMVGAAVQTVYLAAMSVGGQIQTDISVVAYPAVALGILAGGTSEIAIAIATTLGLLGIIAWNVMAMINVFWNNRAIKAALQGDEAKLNFNIVWGPQITYFLVRVVPSFLVLYFGADFVSNIQVWAPAWLMGTLSVAGSMLPAVGISLILNMLIHNGADWVYFIGGFMMVVYLGLGLIPIAIFALICAVVVYRGACDRLSDAAQAAVQDDMEVTL